MLSEKLVVSFQYNSIKQKWTISDSVRIGPFISFCIFLSSVFIVSNTSGYWCGLAEVFNNCHIVQKSGFSF